MSDYPYSMSLFEDIIVAALDIAGVRSIVWAPLTCIQGARESDSLCPLLTGTRAERIVLPGGHFLQHDDAGVARLIVARVAAAGQMTKP